MITLNAEQALTLDDVTVIIVTYNSAHCIDALANDLAEFKHVLVSDNASDDGTCDAVRLKIPQAQILSHSANLGFGAANNRALAQVHTPFVLLLNPDCQITRPAALAMLAAFVTYPQAAVVAPQLCGSSGALEINYRWPASHWKSKGVGADAPCSVGFVCGAAMMLQIAQTADVGWFDEAFFLYYEDDDLCLRLFEAKRSILVLPHIQLMHASRGSVRGAHPLRSEYGRGFHHAQSKIVFARKHVGPAHAARLRWRTLVTACLSLPLRLLLLNPKHVARHWGRIVGLSRLS
jgi:N-acetylglucosaminyl-diphospho-decaprenol L-rhamnosyltransferase